MNFSNIGAMGTVTLIGNLPAAINWMEALSWPRWLKAEYAKLVRARADGTPWKLICWRFGVARATAHRRWRYALRLIAYKLNGQMLTANSRVL
jgi:hypothetical protein